MTGSVSIQPQGTGDWVQGTLNRPLTIGDNVWADKDSRAELSLGTGVMRISSETSLTLTNVTNDAVQVQLHQGTIINPLGASLQPGMPVTVRGYWANGQFFANRIRLR